MADLILSAQVECALEILLDYLWQDESADYELCSLQDKDRHIFKEVMVLDRWMNEVRAANKTICRELSDNGEPVARPLPLASRSRRV